MSLIMLFCLYKLPKIDLAPATFQDFAENHHLSTKISHESPNLLLAEFSGPTHIFPSKTITLDSCHTRQLQ